MYNEEIEEYFVTARMRGEGTRGDMDDCTGVGKERDSAR